MLETLKLRANLIESSCLIFVNCFLPCMIIVFFYACGLRWSIYFLQSRRGSQGWLFLFLSRGVSHDRKRGVLLDLCQLFPSMHVAPGDRFVSFKADGGRRDGSFFFYRAGYRMARREKSCLIFANCFLSCMIIVSFHACGLRWSICFLQSRRGS